MNKSKQNRLSYISFCYNALVVVLFFSAFFFIIDFIVFASAFASALTSLADRWQMQSLEFFAKA